MTFKKLTPIIVVVICILSLAGYYFKNKTYKIEIPIDTIQDKLNEKLPLEKNIAIINITLSNPIVDLDSQKNKLLLGLDIAVNMIVKKYNGSLKITTDIGYNKEKGQVNLIEPEVQSINIPKLSNDKINIIQNSINKIIKSLINDIPVYTIEPKNAKLFAARHLLKQIKIQHPGIIITLGIN